LHYFCSKAQLNILNKYFMAKVFSTFFIATFLFAPVFLLAQAQERVAIPGLVAQNNGGSAHASANDGGGTTSGTGGTGVQGNILPVLQGYYITLAEATPQYMTFNWHVLAAAGDNPKITVRRNNQIIATYIVQPNETNYTLNNVFFQENDMLYVSIRSRQQVLEFKAKYKNSLQNTLRGVAPSVRPLATVESVHPRRGRAAQRTTAPQLLCEWVRNIDMADQLYYNTNDVTACLQAGDVDSTAFYACLGAHTAYFTYDNQVHSCGSSDGSTNPNRLSTPKNVVATAQPNPFQTELNLKYRLSTQAAVRIQLFNIEGVLVQTQNIETLSAGDYTATLDTAELPTGIYFYTINNGGVLAQGRVVKIQ
jgi:Secretion system C-terminal sorting domain